MLERAKEENEKNEGGKQKKHSKRGRFLSSGDGKDSEGGVEGITEWEREKGWKREKGAKRKAIDDLEEGEEAENKEKEEEEIRDTAAPKPKPKPKPNTSPSPKHLEKPVKGERLEDSLASGSRIGEMILCGSRMGQGSRWSRRVNIYLPV